MPAQRLAFLPLPTRPQCHIAKPLPPEQLFTCWRGLSFSPNELPGSQPAQEAAKAPPPSSLGRSCPGPALTSFRRGLTGITRYESL